VAALVRHPAARRILERAAAGERVGIAELALDQRHIMVAAEPLTGRPGAVAALVDLTDLRRLEDVRRDFVANASHELKTPLTSIRGYAETLLSDDLPPDMQRRFLQTIHNNSERLQRIVEDLLDLSRIESGGWTPEFRPVLAAAAARDAWQPFHQRADQAGVTFDAPPDGQRVRADAAALRQIFTNLFDNALRHSRPGGRIVVRELAAPAPAANGDAAGSGPAREWIAIEVSDTGSGIPGHALDRIFERFYRVDPARSREAGGTGLGLSIVKHLVERMGGDIVAESELGRGTTIRFKLPASAE
jgi:two-component system, OmpR family, phosphate regulon sensor histidine kinase PhoR